MNKYFFKLSLLFAGLGSHVQPAAMQAEAKVDKQEEHQFVRLKFNNEQERNNFTKIITEHIEIKLERYFALRSVILNMGRIYLRHDLETFLNSFEIKPIKIEYDHLGLDYESIQKN